jgi:hypothetical protein
MPDAVAALSHWHFQDHQNWFAYAKWRAGSPLAVKTMTGELFRRSRNGDGAVFGPAAQLPWG